MSSTPNYSRSEWTSLSIQERIRAMNQVTGDEEVTTPQSTTEQQEQPEEKERPALPKRSSVVDIWRKREGGSPKVVNKEKPAVKKLDKYIGTTSNGTVAPRGDSPVSVPWPDEEEESPAPKSSSTTPSSRIPPAAAAPAPPKPPQPSWKSQLKSRAALASPVVKKDNAVAEEEADLTILPAEEDDQEVAAVTSSTTRSKSVVDVWTKRALTIPDSPMTVDEESIPEEVTPRRSSVVDIWTKRTGSSRNFKEVSSKFEEKVEKKEQSPWNQRPVTNVSSEVKDEKDEQKDLVIVKDEEQTEPSVVNRESSVVDRYKRVAGSDVQLRRVASKSEEPEAETAEPTEEAETSNVTNRWEPFPKLRKVPTKELAPVNQEDEAPESVMEEEQPQTPSVANRWNPTGGRPQLRKVSKQTPSPVVSKAETEDNGASEVGEEPALTPSVASRWTPKGGTPQLRKVSKRTPSPVVCMPFADQDDDATEPQDAPKSVMNRWSPQVNGYATPLRKVPAKTPPTESQPSSEQGDDAAESAPKSPERSNVVNRWNPQLRSVRTKPPEIVSQPSVEKEDDAPESEPKSPERPNVVNRWNPQLRKVPLTAPPRSSQPESGEDASESVPKSPERSSVANRWNPQRSQLRVPSPAVSQFLSEVGEDASAETTMPSSVANRWNQQSSAAFPQLRKVPPKTPPVVAPAEDEMETVAAEQQAERDKPSVVNRWNPQASPMKTPSPVASHKTLEQADEDSVSGSVEPKKRTTVTNRWRPQGSGESPHLRKVPTPVVAIPDIPKDDAVESTEGPVRSSVLRRYNPQAGGSDQQLVNEPTASDPDVAEEAAAPEEPKRSSVLDRYKPQSNGSTPVSQLRKVPMNESSPIMSRGRKETSGDAAESNEEPEAMLQTHSGSDAVMASLESTKEVPTDESKSSIAAGQSHASEWKPFSIGPEDEERTTISGPKRSSILDRYKPQGTGKEQQPKEELTKSPESARGLKKSSVLDRYKPQHSATPPLGPRKMRSRSPVASQTEASPMEKTVTRADETAVKPKRSIVLNRWSPVASPKNEPMPASSLSTGIRKSNPKTKDNDVSGVDETNNPTLLTEEQWTLKAVNSTGSLPFDESPAFPQSFEDQTKEGDDVDAKPALGMPPLPDKNTEGDSQTSRGPEDDVFLSSTEKKPDEVANSRTKAIDLVNLRRQQQARSRKDNIMAVVSTESFESTDKKKLPVVETPVPKAAAAPKERSAGNSFQTNGNKSAPGGSEESPFQSGTSAFRVKKDFLSESDSNSSKEAGTAQSTSSLDKPASRGKRHRNMKDFLKQHRVKAAPVMYTQEDLSYVSASASVCSHESSDKPENIKRPDGSVNTIESSLTGSGPYRIGASPVSSPTPIETGFHELKEDDEKETSNSPPPDVRKRKNDYVHPEDEKSTDAVESNAEAGRTATGDQLETSIEHVDADAFLDAEYDKLLTSPTDEDDGKVFAAKVRNIKAPPELDVGHVAKEEVKEIPAATESVAAPEDNKLNTSTDAIIPEPGAPTEEDADTALAVAGYTENVPVDADTDTVLTLAGEAENLDDDKEEGPGRIVGSMASEAHEEEESPRSTVSKRSPEERYNNPARRASRKRLLQERRRGARYARTADDEVSTASEPTPRHGRDQRSRSLRDGGASKSASRGSSVPRKIVSSQPASSPVREKPRTNQQVQSAPSHFTRPSVHANNAQTQQGYDIAQPRGKEEPQDSTKSRWADRYNRAQASQGKSTSLTPVASEAGASDTLTFFSGASSGYSATPSSMGSHGSLTSPASALSNRASRALMNRRRKKLTKSEERSAKDLARRVISQTIKEHPRPGVDENEEFSASADQDGTSPHSGEASPFFGSTKSTENDQGAGLAGRYNTSARFMDSVQSLMSGVARNLSFGSETTEGSSQVRSVGSTSDSEAWMSGRMRKSHSSINRQATSDSTDLDSSVQTGLSRRASDGVVTENFVSESSANLEALKSAYKAVSLHQIAMDLTDEVSTATNLNLKKIATNLNDGVSAASESLRTSLGGASPSKCASPSKSPQKSPRRLQIPKSHGDAPTVDEEVAIEVEFVEDSDDEDEEEDVYEEDPPPVNGHHGDPPVTTKEPIDDERFEGCESPAGEPSQEQVPSSSPDRRRAYV